MEIVLLVVVGLAVVAAGLHLGAARAFRRRALERVEWLRRPLALGPERGELPPLARRCLARAAPDGGTADWVRLEQRGAMRLAPGKPPLSFTAEQWIDARRPAFVWRAAMTLAGPVRVEVLDAYTRSRGSLEARLLGSWPVAAASGPDVDRGELLRYLAEIAWCPPAMAANPHLEWHQLDATHLELAARVGAERAAVVLELDETAAIVGMRGTRPRRIGDREVETPWAGAFAGHRDLDGYRVPTRGEVWWELADGPFTYWQGTITRFQAERR